MAIAEDGHIVYDRGFGQAKADTRFPIASVTKMFAAVSVMQLAEQHKVDLDAKVAAYLPDAPYADQITIRQLLQHTSGLWNYGDAAFQSGAVATPTTSQRILALAAAQPLGSPPGSKYAYSNTGYVVLGCIVERVTRQPLAAYEREHILIPAGMNATTFGAPANGPVAVGYMSAFGPVAAPFDFSWLFADDDAFPRQPTFCASILHCSTDASFHRVPSP